LSHTHCHETHGLCTVVVREREKLGRIVVIKGRRSDQGNRIGRWLAVDDNCALRVSYSHSVT